jgi:catechol 2,3-dioxygenase-like lactoylglutathione lyase family enzyme
MTALSFGHIGVGVADIDAAVDWYSTVFGFKILRPPFETAAAGGSSGEQAHDVLGPRFRRMRQAFLVSGDGIGIELFELVDPPHERREPSLEYWRSGVFHFCLTAPDIEEVTARVVAHGGVQRSRIWPERPPHRTRKMVYLEDPWGTIIELHTHRCEEMYA